MPSKNNLARKLGKSPSFSTVAVVVTPDTAEKYREQNPDRDLGATLSDRLEACVDHTADKPLYFTDADRVELERLLDANFSKPSEVIAKLRSLLTVVKIDDGETAAELTLTPVQLYRLADRARTANLTPSQLALRLSQQWINGEIGLY